MNKMKGAVLGLLVVCLGVISGSFIYLRNDNKNNYSDIDYDYITDSILDNELPVINEVKRINKPFLSSDVTIKVNYYDYKASEDNQKNSLIYYEGTYLQNSGVAYGNDKDFDVVSVLDGTVIDVKEDQSLNTIVTIRHSNEVISVYQGLKDVTVKTNDIVDSGAIIGKSSNSNMLKDYKSTLLFELMINGNTVNPEDYYGKSLEELS